MRSTPHNPTPPHITATTKTMTKSCAPLPPPPPRQDAFLRAAVKLGVAMMANRTLLPRHAQLFIVVGTVQTSSSSLLYQVVLYDEMVKHSTPNPKVFLLSHDTFAVNLEYLWEVCGCANTAANTPILPAADGSYIMGIIPSPSSSSFGGMSDEDDCLYIEPFEDRMGGMGRGGNVAMWGNYEKCMGAIVEEEA